MSYSGQIYIGPYLQILEKKSGFDLEKFLVDEHKEKLFQVPSECFNVNYTLLISNQGKLGQYIHCEEGGKVVDFSEIDIEAELKKFQNKYGDMMAILGQNYQKVILKHGMIYYSY